MEHFLAFLECGWVVFGGFTLHSLHCTFGFIFQGLLECPRRLLQRQFSSININITIINNQGWTQKSPKNWSARRPGSNRYLPIAHCRRPRSRDLPCPSGRGLLEPLPDQSQAAHPRRQRRTLSHGNLTSEGVCGPWTLGYMTAHWRM